MSNFRELLVWQKSIELVSEIYSITKTFPKEELFGIVAQLRRASISIPSNIAEGSSFRTSKEFNHFLNIAIGSSYELETQITISKNLNFIDLNHYDDLIGKIIEIQKMTTALKRKIS